MIHWKETRLKAGESFVTSEKGNSMLPRIKSGQEHRLEPVEIANVRTNDIVFCKIKGSYYTHLVFATDPIKGCQIGNNKGRINGWTKAVFGKVTEVY